MSREAESSAQPQAAEATTENLLMKIAGTIVRDPSDMKNALDWVTKLAQQVMTGEMTVSKDIDKMINLRMAELDELISLQLNEVMHHEDFQRLESAWRGLAYLINETETSSSLKIKVLNVSKSDLKKDLTSASEFDQSQTFKKVYEEEYGTLGGNPFGVLIGDYEFGRGPEDMVLLEGISKVAMAAHAPFISAASPSMLNFDKFTELAGPRDLEKIFEGDAYLKWKMFRETDESKYVGLCLPHVLLRLPYGKETVPVEQFDYEEKVDGRDHSKYLWGNAAYAFAARLTDAFAKHEWCAAIRGVEGGGLVKGLPTHQFMTDEGDVATKCPTELAITERRENELSRLGFIPLCYYKGTDRGVFMAAQSANKAKKLMDPDAAANASLSAQLQYTLAAGRFAHFLKVIMRDKVGSFMSKDNCQEFLNKWIANYVLLDDRAGQEAKARFPLREADVQVAEIAGKPGWYSAVAYLRPHFQLEGIQVSLRWVTKVPKKG